MDNAGISYIQEIMRFATEELCDYDQNQGARIQAPREITEKMANNFFFRFWGRQDVYAKRNEKRDTREAGYYTQCYNFWQEICPKKRREKINCKQFVFCDSSEGMIRIAKERFKCYNAEFSVCDVQKLVYANEFDVITAIQVNHYLHMDERKMALQNIYEALKDKGLFVSFENFAPFTDLGKRVCLEKWKKYQMRQGKSVEECEKHIKRYGEDYFPISILENKELMRNCGFEVVEILWLSNMQVGLWGIK